MLFFVKGEVSVGLGNDTQEAQGNRGHMPAGLKHSIKVKTPVVILLVLLKGGSQYGKGTKAHGHRRLHLAVLG